MYMYTKCIQNNSLIINILLESVYFPNNQCLIINILLKCLFSITFLIIEIIYKVSSLREK